MWPIKRVTGDPRTVAVRAKVSDSIILRKWNLYDITENYRRQHAPAKIYPSHSPAKTLSRSPTTPIYRQCWIAAVLNEAMLCFWHRSWVCLAISSQIMPPPYLSSTNAQSPRLTCSLKTHSCHCSAMSLKRKKGRALLCDFPLPPTTNPLTKSSIPFNCPTNKRSPTSCTIMGFSISATRYTLNCGSIS